MNIKAIASRIGMDYDNVIEDFCGDTSEVRKKLESFITDCNFTALESAVEQNDEELIKKCAHKVKKTGEKLGLTDLVKYAAILEDAKNKDFAVIGSLLYTFSGFSVYNIFFFQHLHQLNGRFRMIRICVLNQVLIEI